LSTTWLAEAKHFIFERLKLDVDLCDSFKRAAAPPSAMGEIYLDKALGLLSSDKQKERTDGLAGLILSLSTAGQGLILINLQISNMSCSKTNRVQSCKR
jgi:hypothetical protein